MTPNYMKPPYSFFAPPGVVTVSVTALRLAREFAEDVRRLRPDDEWVISFDWADSRIVRRPKGGPREELGPGLDLVAYDRPDIPPEVLQRVGTLEFAVKIPSHVYRARISRLIDTDDDAGPKLILR